MQNKPNHGKTKHSITNHNKAKHNKSKHKKAEQHMMEQSIAKHCTSKGGISKHSIAMYRNPRYSMRIRCGLSPQHTHYLYILLQNPLHQCKITYIEVQSHPQNGEGEHEKVHFQICCTLQGPWAGRLTAQAPANPKKIKY